MTSMPKIVSEISPGEAVQLNFTLPTVLPGQGVHGTWGPGQRPGANCGPPHPRRVGPLRGLLPLNTTRDVHRSPLSPSLGLRPPCVCLSPRALGRGLSGPRAARACRLAWLVQGLGAGSTRAHKQSPGLQPSTGQNQWPLARPAYRRQLPSWSNTQVGWGRLPAKPPPTLRSKTSANRASLTEFRDGSTAENWLQ